VSLVSGFCRLIVLGSLLVAGNPGAFAHQKKEALTEILFNTRSGNLEVMHRYLIHDAEHAVRQLVDSNADLITSNETREAFAQYAVERFALLADDGTILDLHYVGQEVDSAFLWVYQEMPLPESLAGLGIIDNAMRDIWPEQNNLVNIERNGEIQSLNFNGSTEWLSVKFEQ
jgi:hypothetical protein